MKSKLEQGKELLDISLLLLRYPDNGWARCRWCTASRPGLCNPSCWYAQHIKAIDDYREKVKTYLEGLS